MSPVHFLKISHHASHNGTPADELLDEILPTQPLDARDRVAVASTYPSTYPGIPDPATLGRLEDRGVRWVSVYEALGDSVPPEDDEAEIGPPVFGYLEFEFPAGGTAIGVQPHVLPAT